MITFLIFFLTYAVVAVGRAPGLRVDRTGAAIIGAILMIVTGAIGFDEAVQAVDFRTLVLLFGMMVLVAHLRLAGGFAALVRVVSARIANPALLLVALVVTTGLLSALFVNDTICLVFTPIVLDPLAQQLNRQIGVFGQDNRKIEHLRVVDGLADREAVGLLRDELTDAYRDAKGTMVLFGGD